MSLYLDSKSFVSVFVISWDFCEGKLFGFKMLSKFGFYALVVSAEEEQDSEHLSVPWGKLGHGMWKDGYFPLISFPQNRVVISLLFSLGSVNIFSREGPWFGTHPLKQRCQFLILSQVGTGTFCFCL